MSRIASLNQRYFDSAALVRSGVEIHAVGDPQGARFDLAVRRLVVALRDEGPGLWDDLVGASKALRWKLITQPQPIKWNPDVVNLASEVVTQARRIRGAVDNQDLLDVLEACAVAVAHKDSERPVGTALREDCLETGTPNSVVIAASRAAREALKHWLRGYDIKVLTYGEFVIERPECDQAYVVGPPRFYPPSLVTAPVTGEVCFVLPAWFGDRRVPQSAIALYAEGAVRVEARVFTIGDTTEAVVTAPVEPEDEDAYLPEPVWGVPNSTDRGATNDEVHAHKVLLSGNLAMWLDDGDRIRSLDPHQPSGERVTYTEVPFVREGTYLLLRQGVTERGALRQAALAALGRRAGEVDATQAAWKELLARRLQQQGFSEVVKDLRSAGVKAADRARAWIDPSLIRPNSDQDFESLLQWLGVPIQPTFGYAALLRKTLYQVSSEIGKQLEAAVSAADLTELEVSGHLGLDIATEGFRGILATRVLAVSPHSEIVARHDARVPFEDRSGQWLE